jgi:hypothetical protein
MSTDREREPFYALRYVANVPLPERKHDLTLGRFDTFADAEAARRSRPNADDLEVVVR